MIDAPLPTCLVCDRKYIPISQFDEVLVCNAESCQIHGRINIVVPKGLFPQLNDWHIYQHTSNEKHPFNEMRLHRTAIRFLEKAVVVLTERYDPSDGFYVEPTYAYQDRAFIVAEFIIEE